MHGSFDHIWTDSGTALTASVLISTNLILKRSSLIHVVLMAGDEQYFKESYQQANQWLANILRINGPELAQCHFHFPVTGKSFGSTNTQVKKAIVDFARSEGLLTDPIYTAKLFMTAKAAITSGKYPGSHLIIHSGGGTGLMGFAEKMEKLM
jgi:1-aminocyclopropane-1-carboxylate deaminase/D-cysteine desulfhydrase-like pyridoxal-dependent ACC family enzyme